MAARFEQEIGQVSKGCRLWEYGPPDFTNPEKNQRDAQRLEDLAKRLDEIHANHGLGESRAGKHVIAAQEQLTAWAEGLREYPLGSMSEKDLKLGHIKVEAHLSHAVDAARGVKPVPFETADKLDRLYQGVLDAGEHVMYGRTVEALQVVEQFLSTARGLRDALARQAERGIER